MKGGGEETLLMTTCAKQYGSTRCSSPDNDSKDTTPAAALSQDDEAFSHTRVISGASSQKNHLSLTLSVSLLIGLVAGSLYGFGRYSRDLRDTLGISQSLVQRFGILLDTGNYVGHPATGMIYDHFGPKVSCLAAAIIVFLSYSSIYVGLDGASLWIMDVGFFGVGFGSGLGYIAALGSTTSAFVSTPHLGRAVGVVAAGYGFSSTIVGLTYHTTGLTYFFLLWAILVAVANLIGVIVFTSNEEGGPQAENESITRSIEDKKDLESRLLHRNPSHSESSVEFTDETKWTTWKRFDFWLLFFSFACISGCGLMIINNISTMVQSLGGEDGTAGLLIFALSICNVVGRVMMGFLADHPKFHKLDLYRYSSLLMAMGLFISFAGGASVFCLCLTVALAAIAYGGSWVLIVGILADLFGKANFGKDYGLIAMGPAVSGMIFNSWSANFYEEHALDDSDVCIGASCYRDAYLMTAASAVVGYLILLWLLPSQSSTCDQGTSRYGQMFSEFIESETPWPI